MSSPHGQQSGSGYEMIQQLCCYRLDADHSHMFQRSKNGTSFVSSEAPSCYALNSRSLARYRVSRYLAEPSASGNTIVGLSDNTADVVAAEAAHKKRIAAKLASLKSVSPQA